MLIIKPFALRDKISTLKTLIKPYSLFKLVSFYNCKIISNILINNQKRTNYRWDVGLKMFTLKRKPHNFLTYLVEYFGAKTQKFF